MQEGGSLHDYISTENANFAFVDNVPGYFYCEEISIDNLIWYKLFASSRAGSFCLGDEIALCNGHQLVDLVICCRGALRVGGTIMFDLDIRRHPPGLRRRLERTLVASGFAVHPLICPGGSEPAFDFRSTVERQKPWRGKAFERVVGKHRLLISAIKVSDHYTGSNGSMQNVYVLGDSHIWFISGRDRKDGRRIRDLDGLGFDNYAAYFSGFHLGPSLAYNLGRLGTSTATTEKIEKLFENKIIPENARIMLSFGEIDCRCQVWKQIDEKGGTLEAVVGGIVEQYAAYIDQLASRGFRPIVWGPIAPTPQRTTNAIYPTHGSYEQRKAAVRQFTEAMRAACDRRSVPFVSVFDDLLDESNMTREELYIDPIHLSQRARPLLWRAFGAATGLRTYFDPELD